MPACEPTFHPRAEAARRTRAPTADACRKVNVVVCCPHCKNVIRLREVDGQSRVIKYLCSNCQEIVRIDLLQDEVKSSSDRKSTRLNSSHLVISYAVFCLKKKKVQDKYYYLQNQYRYSTREIIV